MVSLPDGKFLALDRYKHSAACPGDPEVNFSTLPHSQEGF